MVRVAPFLTHGVETDSQTGQARQDNSPIAQGEPFYKWPPKNYEMLRRNSLVNSSRVRGGSAEKGRVRALWMARVVNQ